MLTFDSVKLRLDREQPLTFLEFNYMILQAYDFLELSRRAGCRLQMGGSDQWGNIVNGIELGRRIDGTEVFGVTTPLITTADGAKMGKTARGAVWLNEELLALMIIGSSGGTPRMPTSAVPAPVHRHSARRDRAAGGAAGRRNQPGQDRAGDRGDRDAPRRGGGAGRGRTPPRRPCRRRRRRGFADASVGDGMTVAQALTELGFTASNGEAKRKIAEGAVRLNDEPVTDPGWR